MRSPYIRVGAVMMAVERQQQLHCQQGKENCGNDSTYTCHSQSPWWNGQKGRRVILLPFLIGKRICRLLYSISSPIFKSYRNCSGGGDILGEGGGQFGYLPLQNALQGFIRTKAWARPHPNPMPPPGIRERPHQWAQGHTPLSNNAWLGRLVQVHQLILLPPNVSSIESDSDDRMTRKWTVARDSNMAYQFARYFETVVLLRRPYIRKEWCIAVVENPIRAEQQEDGRWRFWGRVPEFGNRVFRVVTLADRQTILNAFPDRRFKE